MNCNSGEGDNVSLVQGNDHIWVHNCDMFYGEEGSDDDQKKGDGALDCKSSDYVTFSYNHFWDSGKCNLLGLEEGHDKEYHITYHHNWYDHSDSRHPRVRFYTAHIYNNYYDGNSKYGIGGAGGGGSIFAENNYFRNCKYPMMISMQGSDVYGGGSGTFSQEDGSIIKAYGNYMEGQTRFMPYKAQDDPETDWDDRVEFDAYVAESRDEIVPDTVKTVLPSETRKFKEGWTGGNIYNNFDTADDFYTYQADPAEGVPKIVAEYAGRLGGGDFEWSFDNEKADTSYAVDVKLQEALKGYTSKLKFVGGIMGASTKINCTVTFDPGNGEAVKTVTVEVNQTVAQPENPTKIPEGKVSFDGWYHGDVKWNFSDKVTGDMTLVGKWYAEGEGPEEIFHGGTPIGTEKIIHDFTQSGLSSKYFAITGEMHSKSNSGKTVEYDGKVYTGKGLVLNKSTEITFFTTTQSAKLVLLIRNYATGVKVNIDGSTCTSTPGVVEAQLKPGEHTVKGNNSDYLFAIIVIPEGESEIPIYTITIDQANGSAVKTIVLTEGKQITEEDLPTPTKEGDTFLGWVDEDGKEITLPYTPTKSMTIKAKWKNDSTNPGPGGDDVIDPNEVGLH
ncbi:MAG: InlB B-repeat-containing protein, partial [Acetatifactor sp.]|nr:InlB B-repeat-containing protein [Acetatifactor sp.]